MGVGVIFLFTCLFAAIGFGLPAFLPESNPNRDLMKLMIILSAVCCYCMWLITYAAQMNPLFGPLIDNSTLSLMWREW